MQFVTLDISSYVLRLRLRAFTAKIAKENAKYAKKSFLPPRVALLRLCEVRVCSAISKLFEERARTWTAEYALGASEDNVELVLFF